MVEALLTLNEEGNLRPTARDIAAKAGVSLRSLYVHFDDLEALFVAASDRHSERMAALLSPLVTTGSFDERLEAFLKRRITLNETGAGVRRAALLQEPFSPALQAALASGRSLMRSEVRHAFGPEIAGARPGTGPLLRHALEIATSASTWEALRTHQGLTVDDARDHVREMVRSFVGSWGPEGAVAAPAGDAPGPAPDRTVDEPRPAPDEAEG
ncbi:MAG TPA: TetR/AcrR family transcriptional regulator [Acidimicrobiales bacterium]|nr:TetR/AcrR family transcriptional regulator [Acidimicrobiales bacterium]